MAQVPARLTVLHVGTINKPISTSNGYGPIETVIYNIDKGLDALGHRSIVACSADSVVAGEKWATIPRSLGGYCREHTPFVKAQTELHLNLAMARASRGDIDLVHLHEWGDRAYGGRFKVPVPIVMTLHVQASQSGLAGAQASDPGTFAASRSLIHPVAISGYQRSQYDRFVDAAATIHHGIDVDDYAIKHGKTPLPYLFSIGRITPDKGQDTAIAVARRTGKKLILAGCVQNKDADRAFFEQLRPTIDLSMDLSQQPVTASYYDDVIKPLLLSEQQIVYVGELTSDAAKHWYAHASAMLFPIRWGEPFGMVLIESMASGTPVLAFAEGSVPEIVKHGETGFVVRSVEEMVEAVGRIDQLDRGACQRHVQTNFSTQRMASSYAALYRQLIAEQHAAAVPLQVATSARQRFPQPILAA